MSYNDLRKGRWSAPGQEYLVTTVVRDRRPLFVDVDAARPVVEAIRSVEQEARCTWLAWVLMPDHFHGMLSLGRSGSLSGTVGRLKGRSARAWNRRFETLGPLWQPNFHDRALREEDDRRALALYVIGNPVRCGLVESVGDYPFWDAAWL